MKIYKIAQEENALFDHFGVFHDQTALQEYLDYESEHDIPLNILQSIIKNKKLQYEQHGSILCVYENGNPYWFVYDTQAKTFDYKKDIEDWFLYLDNDDILSYMGITEEDVYVSDIGTLKEIRENPGTVYHYTTEENWQAIQEDGFLNQSGGTGLGNRSAYGVFVSGNPDDYADGTYGNVLLTIDLDKFKSENGLGELNIDIEPEYMAYLLKEVMAHKLGFEYRGDVPSDISTNTLIVGHQIPIKYIQATI